VFFQIRKNPIIKACYDGRIPLIVCKDETNFRKIFIALPPLPKSSRSGCNLFLVLVFSFNLLLILLEGTSSFFKALRLLFQQFSNLAKKKLSPLPDYSDIDK
jgi:hypothetical protein